MVVGSLLLGDVIWQNIVYIYVKVPNKDVNLGLI